MTAIRVESYSGYRADERPLRFYLRENALEVSAVEDSWYSPGVRWFKVRAADGNLYVLRHDEGQDTWSLEAFRAATATSRSGESAVPRHSKGNR